MAKHLKLTIKNTQIAEAINLGGLKNKLAKKKGDAAEPTPPTKAKSAPAKKEAAPKKKTAKEQQQVEEELAAKTAKEDAPRIRARSKSVFAEGTAASKPSTVPTVQEEQPQIVEETPEVAEITAEAPPKLSSSEELRRKVFGDEEIPTRPEPQPLEKLLQEPVSSIENIVEQPIKKEETSTVEHPAKKQPAQTKGPAQPVVSKAQPRSSQPPARPFPAKSTAPAKPSAPAAHAPPAQPYVKLGPTGKHIKDLFPPKAPRPPQQQQQQPAAGQGQRAPAGPPDRTKPREPAGFGTKIAEKLDLDVRKPTPGKPGVKELRDVSKPARRQGEGARTFDVRDRHGLRDTEEEHRWRKKRGKQGRIQEEIHIVRPTSLSIRVPISIKDLASEMKLKASELISKLFLQGIIVTLNDQLDDETTIQLLGQEFGCGITIDTSEEQRIRITDKSVKEEIKGNSPDDLILRAPVVAFMGHVDHGKTSLIDAIRKSNRAAGEAGAITQHIGAFRCHTSVGDITVLDTPGHEAFSAMRARGADVTDIVVLVVAGDEGIRQQTVEAIQHAKSAKVTIVVAINKSDKPGFNPENVYRQLSEHELLPEAWGGQTLTVNCSAFTGAGIQELLETLALQTEILELRSNPKMRARGTVLESEMHKGMGSVATVLVQNGTLRLGDSLVFGQHWGRVKTMRDEFMREISEAGPSVPVAITGLSGLPAAGQEFIVVKSEREAREISDARMVGMRQSTIQKKALLTVDNLLQQATPTTKKTLNLILRADVQGSLEALKVALEKIESTKAQLNIIFTGVGEVSESDIQLAATSKAVVIGFHTKIESHADSMIKQLNVQVKLHDIIYHAIDDVKLIMTSLLDKIALESDRGKAEIKAIFKSSHVGNIAGCSVIDGVIQRNNHIRIMREGKLIGKSHIVSLRRNKDDAREVTKGMECGISLHKFPDILVGDILEAYDVTYITQEL